MEIGNDLQFNIGGLCFHLRAPNEKLRSFLRKLRKLQFQKRFAIIKMFWRLAHVRNRRRKEF